MHPDFHTVSHAHPYVAEQVCGGKVSAQDQRNCLLAVIEAHMSDHAGAIAGLIMVVKELPPTNVRNLTISLVYKGSNVQLHSVDSVKAAILESMSRVSSLT